MALMYQNKMDSFDFLIGKASLTAINPDSEFRFGDNGERLSKI